MAASPLVIRRLCTGHRGGQALFYAPCIGAGSVYYRAMAKINIKKLRGRLKLSQAEMADRLGVNQSTVNRIESGQRPPSRPVQRLLEQLYAAREL